MILPHKKTEIDHFIQKGWREGRLMNRRKLMNVLVCLQIFLLCGGAVSAGHAETVVNIENKTIDAILVTVICMECPSFGWGDATPCWDTGNNVMKSVPANTKGQFKCAAGVTSHIKLT